MIFSISTDASNRGNVKLIPLILTYFILEEGTKNKIINFYSDDYESSAEIAKNTMDSLLSVGLSIENVSAYSADNANVNYGKHNSVFLKLRELNKSILKANCNCHVIHNAAKHAFKKLSLDLETLVKKIYSEFSCSTSNVRELKECFEFF